MLQYLSQQLVAPFGINGGWLRVDTEETAFNMPMR